MRGFSSLEIDAEVEMRWRMRPPVVAQGTTFKCWAAAVSSWTRVTRGVAKFRRDELVDYFRKLDLVTPRDGLRSPIGVQRLAKFLGLHVTRIQGGGSLSCSNLCPMLKQSHVLVFFQRPNAQVAHTVVVYGVDRFNICFMDPAIPDLRCEKIYKFGEGADDFLLMWKAR
jgi:hypothetical protein